VEELERQWQARWRPTTAQRTAWSRRKLVIAEVERLIGTGLTPADAVAVLEDQRGSSTLRSLQNRPIAQKQRQVPAGRPKGNGKGKGKGKAQGGRSG
jgi:Transcriptional activator of glycolytic enzymes